MPSTCRNRARSASAGSRDASTAARDATSGRRAHQTCSRFGAGNGVIGVRSRVLSTPISAIGNHRSISRVSVMAVSRSRVISCRPIRTRGSGQARHHWGHPSWERGRLVSLM